MAEKEKDAELEPTSVLNEEDVDSLLTEAQQGSLSGSNRRSAVISADGKRLGTDETVSSRHHDFALPTLMGDREVGILSRLHKEMISALESQLSLFLRSEVSMEFNSLEIAEYRKVLRQFEDPTHLVLFKAEPLPGIGFLEIDRSLALSTVNQVLGGNGQPPKEERNLTKIETDLIEEFILVFIQDWFEQWHYETVPAPSIVAHEVMPSTLQICEPTASMLHFTLDVTIQENSGQIQVVAPLFMVEPMVLHLESKSLTKVEPEKSARIASWKLGYSDVPLSANVFVSAGSMKVADFNDLQVGDTIPLPDDCMEEAVLRLAKKPLFVGQFGVDDGKMALCIQSKLQS